MPLTLIRKVKANTQINILIHICTLFHRTRDIWTILHEYAQLIFARIYHLHFYIDIFHSQRFYYTFINAALFCPDSKILKTEIG